MISFIVPVQYKNTKSYVYKRALELIDIFKDNDYGIELIISDSSKKKFLTVKNKDIQIIHSDYDTHNYSPSKARNVVIPFVKKEYIFFFDVDLAFSKLFIRTLLNELNVKIINGNKSFLMIPCLYMSKKGTLEYESATSKREIIDFFREDYLLGSCDNVLRLAVNTSAILLKKDFFISVGMFSEEFFGHGGEDFELLHRLASYDPHSLKNEDYYVDKVSQFPADYVGFRKYLAYYSLPYFFTDLLLVHKWHERALLNPFYLRRTKNENLLVMKMKKHDRLVSNKIWKSTKKLLKYDEFLKSYLKLFGFVDIKYCGFFKLNANSKIKRPLSAKIRKLVTRPKLFFTDLVKNISRSNGSL